MTIDVLIDRLVPFRTALVGFPAIREAVGDRIREIRQLEARDAVDKIVLLLLDDDRLDLQKAFVAFVECTRGLEDLLSTSSCAGGCIQSSFLKNRSETER